MLKEIIKKLEELKGEEFTLLKMDNTIQEIVGTDGGSIFDGETEEYIERGEYSYTVWADEEKTETADINIRFEVIEESEDKFGMAVKVTDIELL